MIRILKTMKELLRAGEDLVLVTVTASSGAVPRGAGAHMLVGARGRIQGTIGGGAVEYRAEKAALEVLKSGDSRGSDFTLNRSDVANLGMICGGECSVFFHFIPAGCTDAVALAEEAEARFAARGDLWLVSDIGAGGALSLADRTHPVLGKYLRRRPCRLQEEGKDLFIEQIVSSARAYVFGGGHVAQELVPLLSRVGFRCVVMDDRAEFADKAVFPTAEEVILGDFHRVADYCAITEEDYVCVMTRGHAYDTLLQAQILKCRPCYCGVIGSKTKAAGVRKALKEDYGLSDDLLDLVTTPIGLSIQAETPEEIAVSIAAQMILHRAERNKE